MSSEDIATIKLIITDFDGVILESEKAKTQAFYECFSTFPEHIDEIMNYHRNHTSVSRYDKFEYIYKEILKRKYTEDDKNQIAIQFNEIAFQEVVTSLPIPGAIGFLETFSKIVPIYVVSATPVEELKKVLVALGLEQYFEKIYGVPPTKSKILSNILRETGLGPLETLFIGDTNNDLKAAQENQILFIAKRNDQEFTGPIVCEIDNLLSLSNYLIIDDEQKTAKLLLKNKD